MTDAPFDPASPPAAVAPPSEADGTRAALIRAGIELFGRRGFDGTSTRELARAAGVNIAGIAYHFGGKAGLHRACGAAIAATIAERVGAIGPAIGSIDGMSAEAAADLFVAGVCGLGRFMLGRPEAEAIARFMVREQMDPSPTFDILYEALIRPRHAFFCGLFGRATGEDPESEAVVITVTAVLGQIMVFRIGRATALARLGWETIDQDRLEAILAVAAGSVRATIAARRAAAAAG